MLKISNTIASTTSLHVCSITRIMGTLVKYDFTKLTQIILFFFFLNKCALSAEYPFESMAPCYFVLTKALVNEINAFIMRSFIHIFKVQFLYRPKNGYRNNFFQYSLSDGQF